MLLRRFTEHVKSQNWFAVGLDFLIVVMGVFVGLQVSNWNAERARRIADAQYLERLHDEVLESLRIRARLISPRRGDIDSLHRVADLIFSEEDPRPLTMEECTAIHFSHIYTNPSSVLPTISELISSGRLDSLSSTTVRNAILRYSQGDARAKDIQEASRHDSVVLSRKYPSLITLDARNTATIGLGRPSVTADCDLEGMRADTAFRNDFADNKDRMDIYFVITLEEPNELLMELHAALDAELKLEHTPDTGAAP